LDRSFLTPNKKFASIELFSRDFLNSFFFIFSRHSEGHEDDTTLGDDPTSSNNSSQEIDVIDVTREGCEKAKPSQFDLVPNVG
jgi:hypothetical protein